MQFTEVRSEPRYPIDAGFVEIDKRPLPLADLSTKGLGFMEPDEDNFAAGDVIQAFLILQTDEEQFEMPVELTVRRIEDGKVGCSMTCVIPHHGVAITEFLASLERHSK